MTEYDKLNANKAKNGVDPKIEDAATAESASGSRVAGLAWMALGTLLFSGMFLGVKLLGPGVPTFNIVFYRSVVQCVLSVIMLLWNRKNPFGSAGVRLALFWRGLAGCVAVAAFFFAIQDLPLPDAITLQFTTPTFTAILAVFIVGERWRLVDAIGALICLGGVLMIAHPPWLFPPSAEEAKDMLDHPKDENDVFIKTVATCIGVMGAIAAGMAYVMVRFIGDAADALVMVFYYAFISILTAPFASYFLRGTVNVFTPLDSTFAIFMLIANGFFGWGGQYATNRGLQLETAATATLMTNTQIVYSYIFELAFLHETVKVWSMAGTAVIVGYTVLVGVLAYLDERRAQKHPYSPV